MVHLERATRSQRFSPSVKRSLNNSLYPLNSLSCSPLASNWCLSVFNGRLSHRCHSAVTWVLPRFFCTCKGKKKKPTRFHLIHHDRVIIFPAGVQARPSSFLFLYYNIRAVLQCCTVRLCYSEQRLYFGNYVTLFVYSSFFFTAQYHSDFKQHATE